jgi:amino acid adenylation domain-containing protein
MWIIDQLAHGLPTFTTPIAIRFHGMLSRAALGYSLNEIIRRHEVLRTAIRAPEGRPSQFIAPFFRLVLPVTDLTCVHRDARHQAALEVLKREASVPLDPATQVIRGRLIRLGRDDHILFLAVHHIAWDGWSTSVFYDELSHFYGSRIRGTRPTLPELSIQYGDFAIWQRRRLESDGTSHHLEYWLAELGDGMAALDLPTDRPRSLLQSTRAGMVEHLVAAERTRRFREFARAQRVTPAMLMSTGLHAVLHRYAGQRTVASGFPSANRNRSELEELIGFFVNALVLRTDYSDGLSFRALLRQVRTKTLNALRHDDLPFERLVAALDVERDPSRNPLVQVSLSFQNAIDNSLLRLPGLDTEIMELHNGTCQDELGLHVWEQGDELMMVAEFRRDLYEAKTVQRFLRRIEGLIDAGCSDPDRLLADLPLLTDDEQADLSRIAYGPEPYQPLGPLPELVERQAERTPQATALSYQETTLDYGELNERANRLARYLRRRGVKPHTPVAIYLERSADFAVAIIGVLKLGAHYVPLDPALPAGRTAFMLADTDPSAVITISRLRGPLAELSAPVISMDEEISHIAKEHGHDLGIEISPWDIAYIIYTSGSTGRPKGVLVQHRGVTNLIRSLQDDFSLTPADRVLHGVPPSFDASVPELIWPLAFGAATVIAPTHAPADPSAMATLLGAQGVTVTFLSPSVLSAFLNAAPPRLPNWRVMMCIGEAFEPSLVRRFREYAPATRVVNGYGPTEASIGVTRWEIPADKEIPAVVPIGSAMAGTQCHVLDAALQPTPIGARGELCIGGVGVTYGYLNRPALTAERFVPDPFGAQPGARLYLTGDIVRMDDAGVLEFVGRVDDQVKLNGIRVELGEIQAVLEADPSVATARVTVRSDERDRNLLVAYVIGDDGRPPDIKRLRTVASTALPRAMVPARFLVVRQLPLTPSGKLDLRKLPAPGSDTQAMEDKEYVAPRGETEQAVADLVADILGVDKAGRYDDFFELGGNSLQGAQLVVKLGQTFGVEVLLRDLFQASSVAGLAAVVDRRQDKPGTGGRAAADPLTRLNTGGGPPVYLVHPASGGVFCYGELAKRLENSISLYAFQSTALESDEQPLESIPEMARRYIAALRDHQPRGPYILGGWSMGGLVAWEMARRLHELDESVDRLLLIDTPFPAGQPVHLSDAELAVTFAQDLAAMSGAGVGVGAEPPSVDGDAGGTLDEIADTLRRAGLVPTTVDGDLLSRRLGVYKANTAAAGRYQGGTDPYPGDVTLLRSAASASVTKEWRARLNGRMDERVIPGDHYSMYQGANLQVLAQQLIQCLDQ